MKVIRKMINKIKRNFKIDTFVIALTLTVMIVFLVYNFRAPELSDHSYMEAAKIMPVTTNETSLVSSITTSNTNTTFTTTMSPVTTTSIETTTAMTTTVIETTIVEEIPVPEIVVEENNYVEEPPIEENVYIPEEEPEEEVFYEEEVIVEPEEVIEEISDSDKHLLAEIVFFEAGSDWISIYDKAQIVNGVMNRVNDSRFPDTIYDVLTQPYQFSGFWPGMYDYGTQYGPITLACYDAVDYYFEHKSEFGNENSWYGDGYQNHFYYQ